MKETVVRPIEYHFGTTSLTSRVNIRATDRLSLETTIIIEAFRKCSSRDYYSSSIRRVETSRLYAYLFAIVTFRFEFRFRWNEPAIRCPDVKIESLISSTLEEFDRSEFLASIFEFPFS